MKYNDIIIEIWLQILTLFGLFSSTHIDNISINKEFNRDIGIGHQPAILKGSVTFKISNLELPGRLTYVCFKSNPIKIYEDPLLCPHSRPTYWSDIYRLLYKGVVYLWCGNMK